MNKLSKLLTLLVIIAMLVGCLAACKPDDNQGGNQGGENGGSENGGNGSENTELPPFVDYASQVKFNPNSGKVWADVTVKSYIDGDTTHFNIEEIHGTATLDVSVVKARYLGINTPESTGIIEPWGKKASNYTEAQLRKATSIIIESDTATWNLDSTGGRYLLWVWYKTAEDTEYRNINLEILQQGLAFGSNVSSNTYGEYALAAFNQAKAYKLHVFNKTDKDPDFYYGGAISLTLKELKAAPVIKDYVDPISKEIRDKNIYEDKLVKFEAVVAKQVGPTIYVEEYDAENDMYFGMQIFAGYSYPKMGEFAIGNRVSIVGKLSYYKEGKTYQISDLKYKTLDPDWDGGCRVLATEGYSASFNEVDVNTILNGSITIDVATESEGENGEMVESVVKQTFDYGYLSHYSTATVKNLIVKRVWTTTNPESSSVGALTIYCEDSEGREFSVRTAEKLFREVNGEKIQVVASDFSANDVISVKGVIDSYDGEFQIKVFSFDDITFE